MVEFLEKLKTKTNKTLKVRLSLSCMRKRVFLKDTRIGWSLRRNTTSQAQLERRCVSCCGLLDATFREGVIIAVQVWADRRYMASQRREA